MRATLLASSSATPTACRTRDPSSLTRSGPKQQSAEPTMDTAKP